MKYKKLWFGLLIIFIMLAFLSCDNNQNAQSIDGQVDVTNQPQTSEREGNWELREGELVIYSDLGMSEWIGYLNAMPEEQWESILCQIERITLADGVSVVQRAAFDGCVNLKEVLMSDTVYIIEEDAFTSCSSLTHVVWSNNLKIIETDAFSGCGFIEINFPNQLQEIRTEAFYDCDYLKRVIIPGSTYDISGILDCTNLEQIVFLGRKPDLTFEPFFQVENNDTLTVYYLSEYREQWMQDSETEWNGIPMICIDSIDDLPPI